MPNPDGQLTSRDICDQAVVERILADSSVTSIKISVNLQSDTYDGGVIAVDAGTAGWRIERNTGDAVFHDVIIRGDVISSNWDGAEPLNLFGIDTVATAGFALDSAVGGAQFMGNLFIGNENTTSSQLFIDNSLQHLNLRENDDPDYPDLVFIVDVNGGQARLMWLDDIGSEAFFPQLLINGPQHTDAHDILLRNSAGGDVFVFDDSVGRFDMFAPFRVLAGGNVLELVGDDTFLDIRYFQDASNLSATFGHIVTASDDFYFNAIRGLLVLRAENRETNAGSSIILEADDSSGVLRSRYIARGSTGDHEWFKDDGSTIFMRWDESDDQLEVIAPLALEDGSASAPSNTFINATDAGTFLDSGGRVATAVGGTKRFTVSTTLVEPSGDDAMGLGSNVNRWIDVWAVDGSIETSDAAEKKHVGPLRFDSVEFLRSLPASQFKRKRRNRWHTGFTAQDLKATLDAMGIDLAAYVDPGDGSPLGMRTGELLSVLWDAGQKIEARLRVLEAV